MSDLFKKFINEVYKPHIKENKRRKEIMRVKFNLKPERRDNELNISEEEKTDD